VIKGWITGQGLKGGDYVCDGGFVVTAKDARAIGHNEVIPLIAQEFRMVLGGHDDLLICVQDEVFPVVVFDHMGMDHRRKVDVHRIKVRAKAHGRDLFGEPCRQMGRQASCKDAVFTQVDVLKAQAFQVLLDGPRHVPLSLRAGDLRAPIGAALGRDGDIVIKAIDKCFTNFHL